MDEVKSCCQRVVVWRPGRIAGVLVIVLALWYVADQFGFLTISPSVQGSTGLVAIFVIGLVASVSSCTAVLGGLVLALSANQAKRHGSESGASRLWPHVLLQIGRVLGFAFFGAVVGAIGSVLSLSTGFDAVFVIVIAMLMLGLGVNLLDLVPHGLFAIHPPAWLSYRIQALKDSSHPVVPFVLGVASFFLPCGFTQSVQLYALSTGDPVTAALVMTVFALGTAPTLLGLGAATVFVQGSTLKRMTGVAGVLVLVIGLSQLFNGMTLLGVHSLTNPTTGQIARASDELTLVDGRQIIQMEIGSGVYEPDVLQVVEDIPVEWDIWGPKFMGCAQTLVSPGLGINVYLKPGNNVVTFTPPQPGRYVFSCSMGMIRGTMIVLPKKTS